MNRYLPCKAIVQYLNHLENYEDLPTDLGNPEMICIYGKTPDMSTMVQVRTEEKKPAVFLENHRKKIILN